MNVTPREFIEAEEPYKIRFSDGFGGWLDVTYPRIQGEMLSGTTTGRRPSDGRMGNVPIQLPLADVLDMHAQLTNTPQTVIAVATVAALLGGAILCATGVACSEAADPLAR